MTNSPLSELTLGKQVSYVDQYQPDLLQGVPRSLNRDELNLGDALPFYGVDIWNGYELSWLTLKGKPQVGILRCEVPCTSSHLIESKSFKLYLNSFNQTKVASLTELTEMLTRDLSACANAPVKVDVITPNQFAQEPLSGNFDGTSIDELDISIDNYALAPSSLKADGPETNEILTSNLLKSNCLITSQPDWGSIQIAYTGKQLDKEALLRYLISFRQHNEFHEQCVERIFCDIMQYCSPSKLSVYARYTRRGGLDINPFRSTEAVTPSNIRLARQ